MNNKNLYVYEFTNKDHVELLDHARNMKGQVIISAYENEIYNDLLTGWSKRTFKGYSSSREDKTEVLWLNPKCVEMQSKKIIQPNLF